MRAVSSSISCALNGEIHDWDLCSATPRFLEWHWNSVWASDHFWRFCVCLRLHFNFTGNRRQSSLLLQPNVMGRIPFRLEASLHADFTLQMYWWRLQRRQASVPDGSDQLDLCRWFQLLEDVDLSITQGLCGDFLHRSTGRIFSTYLEAIGNQYFFISIKSFTRIVGETGWKDICHRTLKSADAKRAVGLVRGAFEFQGQKLLRASTAR